MNVYQVCKIFKKEKKTLFFLLVTYSVCVPRLPPEAMLNMPDLRLSSIHDTTPQQIPQNTTYDAPIQQPSPPSLSPESINSQGKHSKSNDKNEEEFVRI
jgi:hypothetical protein